MVLFKSEKNMLHELLNQKVNLELTHIPNDSSFRVFDAVKLVGIDDSFIKVILSNGDAKIFGKSSIRW